ncbi:spider silk-constituting element SpiCE-NMa2A5 [Nephila pilipes]|uniref:Spider silk-constituting element SpiCE-NMa2A5 n=1 Tax=Nephila pilipes TaxID=299642 RepID=A0A8X6USZ9_NEPPI|nr:spider silk-constituting element SpiCE-NMa2A5 [Nephila pilipes]
MKFFIAFLVLGVILAFSDADEQPAAETICQSIPVCNPPCVLDRTGPCPRCDCRNTCNVSCTGQNCKIIRNGGQCSCVCGGGNVCGIDCPPQCRVEFNEYGQCNCICF